MLRSEDDFDPEEFEEEQLACCDHGNDPSDCEVICICGHMCKEHSGGINCLVAGCDCDEFEDRE
jgi:hypothetical protein